MKQGGFFKKTIRDVPIDGKVVLLRTDYNVPLGEKGEIGDDYRIRASLPTIKYLLKLGCKVVIISHLGRPDGKVARRFSLEPVAERLSELLGGHHVLFVPACFGDTVTMAVKKAPKSSIVMLENLRFHKGEEANDPAFARQLASSSMAAYFVQDGFGVVHRAHASTAAITHCLPSVAGLLLEKEYKVLSEVMNKPVRPVVAVLGGAKISDKLPLIERFITVADKIIIGGAMANTFLKYLKYPIGKSLTEDGMNKTLDQIYEAAKEKVGSGGSVDDFLIIPEDVAVASEVGSHARRVNVSRRDVAPDEIILDIGLATMDLIDREIRRARTVVWNGTLGMAELEQFAHGSARLALSLATRPKIKSIIGGGDTADFVMGWDGTGGASFSHVSTGGGAALELMSGHSMPGVESLMDA